MGPLADHGMPARACRPQSKGKLERPFRYVVRGLVPCRQLPQLHDLKVQLRQLLDGVANVRVHAATGRVVIKHFAKEIPSLKHLPARPVQAILGLERRITRDGIISVDGNSYSLPYSTRRHAAEVHLLADELRILEENRLVASHPCWRDAARAGSPAVIAAQGRPRASPRRAAMQFTPSARMRRSRIGRWRSTPPSPCARPRRTSDQEE